MSQYSNEKQSIQADSSCLLLLNFSKGLQISSGSQSINFLIAIKEKDLTKINKSLKARLLIQSECLYQNVMLLQGIVNPP